MRGINILGYSSNVNCEKQQELMDMNNISKTKKETKVEMEVQVGVGVEVEDINSRIAIVNEQLSFTVLENFLIGKIGFEKGMKIMTLLSGIWMIISSIITTISLFLTCIATIIVITFFSSISTSNNTVLQNTAYVILSVMILALGISFSVGIVSVLEWINVNIIGMSENNRKKLLIKKANLEKKLYNASHV